MSPPVRNTLVFAAAATLTSVFFINLCASIFHCGCASLWTAATAHCNVHQSAGPRCPWCRYGLVASTVPYFLIVAAQGAVAFSPRSMPPMIRLLAAAAAFPIVGAVIAAIYGLASGYWK